MLIIESQNKNFNKRKISYCMGVLLWTFSSLEKANKKITYINHPPNIIASSFSFSAISTQKAPKDIRYVKKKPLAKKFDYQKNK